MISAVVNIAACLPAMATRRPDAVAICQPEGEDRGGRVRYRRITFRRLDQDSDVIARGLARVGIGRGVRAALMVPPGPRFFALAFGMAKAGVVPVLIDPGLGLRNLGTCLAQAAPEAFIGVPRAHAARLALGWGRATIRTNVTVGGPGLFGGLTLAAVERAGVAAGPALVETRADEMAAILFTSGSTGVPKGVVYTHGNFAAQVASLKAISDVAAGEIDLATFPPFALFAPALGMTTVVPRMDFSRPAQVIPSRIVRAIQDEQVTSMFASPALLAAVARWAVPRKVRLPSLRRVVSAGAPVPADVVEAFLSLLPGDARVITPYGATEALPVAVIASDEILGETRARTALGAGVCVGRPVAGMQVAIIPISDQPVVAWDEKLRQPPGVIGEIATKGPVVTGSYWDRTDATALAKIPDTAGAAAPWHRMGDVGTWDEQGRLWFCGRKSQRVVLADGRTLFTVACEGVFNAHPHVRRSALVGARRGPALLPVLCVELEPQGRRMSRVRLCQELRALGALVPATADIQTFLFHRRFPVDVRHNAKIGREVLAAWATRQLS